MRSLLDVGDEKSLDLAFNTFGKIGPPAVETVAAALQHRNGEVRRRALVWLGRPLGQPAVPDIVRALDDEEEEVRSQAARALKRIGTMAVPAIEQAMTATSPRTRKQCQEILRYINSVQEMAAGGDEDSSRDADAHAGATRDCRCRARPIPGILGTSDGWNTVFNAGSDGTITSKIQGV